MSKGDWQVGDLALCLRNGKRTRAGAVYTVHGICGHDQRCGCGNYLPVGYTPALWLEGVGAVDPATGCEPWAIAARFRKIRPHEADAEDRETIRLLTEKREPVA